MTKRNDIVTKRRTNSPNQFAAKDLVLPKVARAKKPCPQEPAQGCEKTISAIGALKDIKEQNTIEATSLRYGLLADYARDIIYCSTPDGAILEANHTAVEAYGFSRQELLTMHTNDLRAFESVAGFEDPYRTGWADGFIVEAVHRRKDGTTFPVEISARGVEINNTKILVSVVRDITDRRRTEAVRERPRLAPTHPRDDEAMELHFEKLFVLNEVQAIQDAFAAATGVASFIVYINGTPITRPSNFCRLCEIIRKTEKGAADCKFSNAEISRTITDGAVVQKCSSCGLWEGGTNIDVGNRHVATWLIGQVLNDQDDQERILRYARTIGANETEFHEALAQVTHMPREQFEKACQALHLIAQQLSNLAYQNIQQAREITRRMHAEKAMQDSEERLRLLTDATYEGIAITEKGCFIDVNDQFLSMVGYQREELLGKPIISIITPRWQSVVTDSVQSNRTEPYEHVAVRKDGKEIWIESRARIYHANGRNIRIAAVRDITERKNTEEALRQTQKMESLGVLAGGIAHDFNNLLQAIIGQTYLALAKLPEANSVRENIERAQVAATRAADLTRQLLAYSGHGKFLVKMMELNKFIHENLHLLEIAIPKNVELHVEPIESELYFSADVAQLQQVLFNLIINAAEAMDGKAGRITIRTYLQNIHEEDLLSWKRGNVAPTPGTFVVLDVDDTGHGIDQTTIEKIFDPFFTTKFTGRGLGLAAVLGIIRGHNGAIQVESRPNAGTRFRIAFPQTSLPQTTPVEVFPKTNDRLEGTILFIDDEACVREAFTDAFDHSTITVLTAENGNEGITLFKEHQEAISLILLDFSMPGMDGETTFRKLRKIDPHVKIIISSGYAEEDITSKFKGLEITGFIQKPYLWNKLYQLLTEYLNILAL